jgi:aspartate-semialdehyde dehydrogenase
VEHRIALSHASGIVAEAILEKLSESGIAPDSLVLLDRESNVGKRLPYGGSHLPLYDQSQYDLSSCALLLMPQADTQLEAAALQQGCLLLSHSIVDPRAAVFLARGGQEPELSYSETGIRLAGPELSCLLPSLIELERMAAIERLNITLLRSAEFHGKAGVDELAAQTVSLLNGRPLDAAAVFSQQLAFNLLPEAPDPTLEADLRHYLGNSSYPVSLQTVNVPIFHGFVAAVQLQLAAEIDMDECRKRLSTLQDVTLKESNASPISDCNQSFGSVLSNLYQAPNNPACLQFWMLADPMRYGLANNYVNVTDFLLKSYL